MTCFFCCSPLPLHLWWQRGKQGRLVLFTLPAEEQEESCAEDEAQADGGVQHGAGPAGGREFDARCLRINDGDCILDGIYDEA